jgi:hypothetical protein
LSRFFRAAVTLQIALECASFLKYQMFLKPRSSIGSGLFTFSYGIHLPAGQTADVACLSYFTGAFPV